MTKTKKKETKMTYEEFKLMLSGDKFQRYIDFNRAVRCDYDGGWTITYTRGGKIITEEISNEAMKVLRWFWKNIEANNN